MGGLGDRVAKSAEAALAFAPSPPPPPTPSLPRPPPPLAVGEPSGYSRPRRRVYDAGDPGVEVVEAAHIQNKILLVVVGHVGTQPGNTDRDHS